ncbi:hypothetical protein BN11_4180002 [Nostocoides australiense Ben110]|uniref:ROK family protein n=1 Tax=Nostocoides australiense Ben110 TaxID=1193182 RepID=W6JZU9_9MICO|nr:hypothetical protein [Tetrasphaera australiensis]CCH74265.1 hypothetical protein BN11_4180002 [Tetrasphaera australiensis Ben110]
MVSSTPEVRQLNRERIRRELHVRKTCTKAEMAAWTGLSVSTCNTILNEMRADGEIIRTSQEDGYVGRPASRFEYNADYLHVLVVYVVTEHGENTVAFAVADALGQVRLSEQRHPDAITYSVIEELIAEQLATDELIRGIALGIPGVARDGVVEDCDVDALVVIADPLNSPSSPGRSSQAARRSDWPIRVPRRRKQPSGWRGPSPAGTRYCASTGTRARRA